MTTAELPEVGGELPQGAGSPSDSRWPTRMRAAILLILLACLGLVVVLIVQCIRTGGPFDAVPGTEDAGGKQPPPFDLSLRGVQRPWGVAVGQDGTVYVTDTGGERELHAFDSSGEEIASFAPPDTHPLTRSLMYPAVSPSGEIYVSDRDGGTIHIFAADGTPLGEVTPPAEIGTEWHPLGLAFDDAGDLYVTDLTPGKHRLLVLDEDGDLKLELGSEGTGDDEFSFPNGVAVDEQGRIYVADSNNGRIQVFDETGQSLQKIGRGLASADLSMPRGIAIDGNRLYVVDTSRHQVQVYDVSEELEFLHVISGQDEGGLQFPNGLALDGDGGVYVADSENNRVQVWRYD